MKERFVIIVVAIIAGLFITSAFFFIYQSTRNSGNSSEKKIVKVSVTPQPNNSLYLKVSEPSDESLTNNRSIQVKGVTNPDNVIIVSTNQEDVSGKPTQDGNFSVSADIDAGANEVIVRSIAPNGDSVSQIMTVTYSTEEF